MKYINKFIKIDTGIRGNSYMIGHYKYCYAWVYLRHAECWLSINLYFMVFKIGLGERYILRDWLRVKRSYSEFRLEAKIIFDLISIGFKVPLPIWRNFK